jgi:8-oxo-dGTP diphosphatase
MAERKVKLATLCYVRQGGRTLMLHRTREGDYHRGKYNGLGGKLGPGESPEECMQREVFEESGLKPTRWTLRGFITFPAFDGVNDWYVWLYTIEAFTGELRPSPEGELCWVDDAALGGLELWEGDRIFLPWLRESKLFSAKFVYENGIFKGYEVKFY